MPPRASRVPSHSISSSTGRAASTPAPLVSPVAWGDVRQLEWPVRCVLYHLSFAVDFPSDRLDGGLIFQKGFNRAFRLPPLMASSSHQRLYPIPPLLPQLADSMMKVNQMPVLDHLSRRAHSLDNRLSLPTPMAGHPRPARYPPPLIYPCGGVAVGLFEITLGGVPESVRRLAIQRATGFDWHMLANSRHSWTAALLTSLLFMGILLDPMPHRTFGCRACDR
jgi:hypothetical protein